MKKLFLTLLLILFLPALAFAISLDQAKANGSVGETPSGYLEAVSNPSADVRALINDINGKRRAQYQKIASKNGTKLSAVEMLAGKKAINKTPSGQYVKLPNGTWKKK